MTDKDFNYWNQDRVLLRTLHSMRQERYWSSDEEPYFVCPTDGEQIDMHLCTMNLALDYIEELEASLKAAQRALTRVE
ncbi:hypothetical protein LCGC14_1317310 [marine sediment metagenome]|uniref:Uncharacterized protein n=1 Tax=marine sediment metagenome TaxID=412755 RepID=A0A0F9N1D4_9ZZZZ